MNARALQSFARELWNGPAAGFGAGEYIGQAARKFICGLAMLLMPCALSAQDSERINIYRYVLDIDVPEPAALVAIDMAPLRVPLGSTPKPLAAALVHQHDEGGWRSGVAVDAAPYHVLGGGVRSKAAHRAMTVRGRLMRVLTKTVVSVAAVPLQGTAYDFGVGVRSTLHDPHDPTTASRLPEQVDSILQVTGTALPGTETDLRGVSADLRDAFAAAEREMRARSGDVQVSAGWGLSRVSNGGEPGAAADRRTRHTLWLAGQHTRGPRTDVLATVQLLDAFDGDRKLRAGAGIQAKSASADLRAELAWDATDRRLHPGAAVASRLLPGVGATVSLSQGVRNPGESGSGGVLITTLLRWYFVTRY